MWKESLRIGVNNIDEQHKELFMKTEELLEEVQRRGVEHKQKCIDTILFLKNYAVRHFADEEAFQKLTGYKGYEEHKKTHEKFVTVVLEHEKKMVESDFSESAVKSFTGMLIAWLLYHVADADQKIAKKPETAETKESTKSGSNGDIVYDSVCDVLSKMAGLDGRDIKKVETQSNAFDESYAVEVELTGGITGYITLVYPYAFVRNFIHTMMDYVPENLGELEISALFETTDIISGAICCQIAKSKDILCDITTPQMTQRLDINPDERFTFDTGIGLIEADIVLNYE
jgi:hemerythrin-like metal-binding protein